MCGIAGVAFNNSEKTVDSSLLRKMTDIIRHRGPDGEGHFIAPGIGLGMRRLSIIDLTTGEQPIFNENGTLALVCNGEIYNYVELREQLQKKGHSFSTHTDVEVIVHLYEDYGSSCVDHLRGMFAFALWNNEKKELMLARDRLGIKPLHYTCTAKGDLYFGSEIKSLLCEPSVDRTSDAHAMQDLFIYGYVRSPRTLFKHITRLAPGHVLIYKNGSTKLNQYWDITFAGENSKRIYRSEDEWAEALRAEFEQSVRIHLRSDVPVCAWLSPGIDSSAIVSMMKKVSSSDIHTFSLGFEDASCDELSRVKTLNQYAGFDIPNEQIRCTGLHFDMYPKTVWFDENPDTTGVHILQQYLSEQTAKRYKVVLTGEGSDELFAGYPWHALDKLARLFAWIPLPLRRLMLLGPVGPKIKPWGSQIFLMKRPIDMKGYAALITADQPEILANVFSADVAKELTIPRHQACLFKSAQAMKKLHPLENVQYFEMKTRMVDWILNSLDKMSMSQSLELRVPFLDHTFVELALSIPASLKMKFLREKHIFRESMRNALPRDIVNRKKFGLRAPCVNWLKGKLPAFAEEMLSAEALKKTGYFDSAFVARVREMHQAGKKNYTKPLMSILGVQLWHNMFVDM